MIKKITKTELRKNIFHSDNGNRITLGFFVDDEPYFLSYTIDEFDYADNFETLCVNAFLKDLKQFLSPDLLKNDIHIFYRKELLC